MPNARKPVSLFRWLVHQLNPFINLGKKQHSILFSLFFMLTWTVLLESYAQVIVRDPKIVGLPAIILNIVFIVYFSLRNGLRAGFIATGITILYYAYIMYSRHYEGARLANSINVTIGLGIVYLIISAVIGWLKQTVDDLIGKEKQARIHAEDAKTRLQSIMEQLPVGVIITDKHGTLDLTNKQIEQLGGIKMPMFTLGKPETYERDNSFIAKENGKKIADEEWPLMETFRTGNPVEKFIFLKRPDGRKFYLQIRSSLIRNKKKATIAAVAIINDVTKQKEIEERKDDFIDMASHELKTPLTSSKLFIGSLKRHLKTQEDKKGEEFLEKIDKQISKLTTLVKELLDVTKINQGRLSLVQEYFTIEEVVKEIVADLQPTAKQKLHISASTNEKVFCDKEKIMQVVTNLLTNAMKYSPDDKDILIASKREDKKIIVSVQDFGIGIPPAQQEKIFDRFYQAHQSDKNTYPGIGLGLFIASEIVRLHKGKIWVESTQGEGSTFYFSLPIKT